MSKERNFFEFEEFRLDAEDKTLWRGTEKVPLPLKAVEMLILLVENRGRTVTRNEILETLWADTYVDENILAVTVSSLRKSFGERKDENRFIETVPRRGYRFVANVSENRGNLVLEKHTVTEITLDKGETAKKAPINRIVVFAGLGILIITLVSFLAYFFWNPSTKNLEKATVVNPNTQTIAVLPFRNLTPSKTEEHLSLGLTDALITKLAGLRELTVRPTSSVLSFAQEPPTPQAVLEKLKVENYLEGTIQKVEKRLRVSVQLVKTSDGSIVWARKFDVAETDLLNLQDAISGQVVETMRFKLSPEDREHFARRDTNNDEAFNLYLQGRYFWNKRTSDDLQKSIEFFNQAKEKDPHYALAYVGLADAYQLLAEYRKFSKNNLTPAEAFAKSREASRKALELDEHSAEAHTSLAYTLAFYDWNWPEAEREFKRAIEINPNYATARQWYHEYFIAMGRFDEAYFEIRKAEELDPTSLIIKADIAGHYYLTRQFDKAIEQTQKILEINPNFIYAYAYQWISYEQKGMEKEAAETLLTGDSIILPPDFAKLERETYQQKGWLALWQLKFEKYREPPFNQMFDHYIGAINAFRTGDTEKTFELLKKSGEARERWFVNLKYDPQWDSIRSDPRFAELVRQANLTP